MNSIRFRRSKLMESCHELLENFLFALSCCRSVEASKKVDHALEYGFNVGMHLFQRSRFEEAGGHGLD